MTNVSVDRESPDVETPPEKYEETEPLDVPYGEDRTCSYLVPQRQQHLFSHYKYRDSYGIFKFWTGCSNEVTVAIIVKLKA